MWRSVAILWVALAAGCGLLPDKIDETANWSAQRLYTEAKELMGEGSYEQAIKLYEKLEAKFPYGRYAQQAQIEVAYAYYRQGERVQAVAACDRFIRLHPNHPNVDYVYYLRGLVHFNEDLGVMSVLSRQDMTERDPKGLRDSFDALKELVTRYPESKYTPDATIRMNYLVNSLAAHEVHVARYYIKRGAYLAAANRAQFAVSNYQQSPAVEEALYILMIAYESLGLTDLRDDAQRVMMKNYPQSDFLARGFKRPGEDDPWWKLW
ncbi:MAG: outer membrane protein assembly factor BamD [Pseudomonadota bacterium]